MITIIVPIYNAEKYLRRCINSILNQDLDFELLLIDDGSTDKSLAICYEYSDDCRISVYHQNNQGVSAARNRGIQLAKYDWITFVDADDCVTDDYVATILSILSDDYDMFIFNIYYENQNYNSSELKYTYNRNNILPHAKQLLLGIPVTDDGLKSYCAGSCAKVFKKKYIEKHEIEFQEELKYAEDLLFNIECIIHANAYMYIDKYIYCYCNNPDSATNKYVETQIENDNIFLVKLLDCLNQNKLYKDLEGAYYYTVLNDMLVLLGRDFFNPVNKEPYKLKVKRLKTLCLLPIYSNALKNGLEKCRYYFKFNKLCRVYMLKYRLYFLLDIIYKFFYIRRGKV